MSPYGSAQQPQGSVMQAGEEEEWGGVVRVLWVGVVGAGGGGVKREIISMRECDDRHASERKEARCGSRMRWNIMPAGKKR